ncbi:MAG TPA: RDD family protein [Steroidobacteraceae bacterium]|nr:RDD family protein [Steroidobacteraceae bacterium]
MTQENPYQPPKAEVADVQSDDEIELASRWARLGAAIIDGLLMSAIILPIIFSTGYWQNAMSGIRPPFATQLGYALIGLVAYLVLNGYLLHSSGQTIGKRVAGTRIVSVDENRVLPLWKIITLRQLPISAVSQIPVVGPLSTIVDMLFVFRGDKRCIHDLIAGTHVIRATSLWKRRDD